jgi:hypothetical protein
LPKSYIFLCEGDHDQECLEEILKSQSIRYLQYSHEKISNTRGGEQKIIRDFLHDVSSKQFSKNLRAIIKNENNTDNCINQLLQILRSIPSSAEICVLLDADTRTLSKLRDNLRNELKINLVTASTFCYHLAKTQKIFILPKSLEIEIEISTGKKLDQFRERSKRLAIIRKYLQTNPQWVQEFKMYYK